MNTFEANREFSADPALLHRLDSAQRRERDPARKMALCLRMAMEVHGAPAAYKVRQDAILKPRVRVSAKGVEV